MVRGTHVGILHGLNQSVEWTRVGTQFYGGLPLIPVRSYYRTCFIPLDSNGRFDITRFPTEGRVEDLLLLHLDISSVILVYVRLFACLLLFLAVMLLVPLIEGQNPRAPLPYHVALFWFSTALISGIVVLIGSMFFPRISRRDRAIRSACFSQTQFAVDPAKLAPEAKEQLRAILSVQASDERSADTKTAFRLIETRLQMAGANDLASERATDQLLLSLERLTPVR